MTIAPGTRGWLAPQTGAALILPRGAVLTVTDPLGEQVSDLVAFARDDPTDALSSGRSMDYAGTIRLTSGHVLYSSASRPMLTILEDTVGRHDFLLTPCSPEMFRILYQHKGPHPSCLENLAGALAAHGIGRSAIPTTFNIFMNVEVGSGGELRVLPPLSRAGDHIRFRAEMDLIIGLTSCSAEMSNNGRFKPIVFEVEE